MSLIMTSSNNITMWRKGTFRVNSALKLVNSHLRKGVGDVCLPLKVRYEKYCFEISFIGLLRTFPTLKKFFLLVWPGGFSWFLYIFVTLFPLLLILLLSTLISTPLFWICLFPFLTLETICVVLSYNYFSLPLSQSTLLLLLSLIAFLSSSTFPLTISFLIWHLIQKHLMLLKRLGTFFTTLFLYLSLSFALFHHLSIPIFLAFYYFTLMDLYHFFLL